MALEKLRRLRSDYLGQFTKGGRNVITTSFTAAALTDFFEFLAEIRGTVLQSDSGQKLLEPFGRRVVFIPVVSLPALW
jgi:hypothetical protein